MSCKSGLGLSLEALDCYLARPNKQSIQRPLNAQPNIPPAVVCSSLEPLEFQLDRWFPASTIGSGESWPSSSQVGSGKSRRMPIGLLWDLARRETLWSIDSQNHIDPMVAIAKAARDAVQDADGMPESIGLVVPNWLKQAQQQTLLDGLAGTGFKWRLTWLPIAAATYWIEHFFMGKTLQQTRRTILGRIAVVHLGLFGCECAIIELIAEPFEGQMLVMPARQRSSKRAQSRMKDAQPGLMSDLLLQNGSPVDWPKGGDAHKWRKMWVTPWLRRQIDYWKGLPQRETFGECPEEYDPPVIVAPSRSSISQVDCDGICWPVLEMNAARKWIDEIFVELEQTGQRLNGAVVTGELASVQIGATSLGERLIAGRINSNYVLISDDTAPKDLLASGAAEQCRRMDAGEPTYLTKLPWLRTVISRVGEPEWISLLADDDPYVMGGQRWARPEPIRGITIPRGEILTLAIDHEDLEHIRESQLEIPSSYEPNQPAELHVAITPAQGNARIELRTVGMQRNRKPVVANLSNMTEVRDEKGNTLEPDGYLNWYPRLAPPLLPRMSDANRWHQVKSALMRLLNSDPQKWDVSSIRLVKDELVKKVYRGGRNITALGSNGSPPDGDVKLIHKLVEGCLEVLRSNPNNSYLTDTTLRCIAYTSWTSPALEKYIADTLLSGQINDDAVLRVIGNCLRSPTTIAKVLIRFERFLWNPDFGLYGGGGLHLNQSQIRVIAELTSYRAEALKEVSPDTIDHLYQTLSRQFNNATDYHSLAYRYLTMAVAFTLRRRVFDESFVPSDSDVARQVKQKCRDVLIGIEANQISVMGGSVDLPRVMKQLIEYVDRIGRGPFLWSG